MHTYYPIIAAGLFVIAAGLTLVGLGVLAMPLAIVPVAWYWAVDRQAQSLGLLAAIALAGLVASGDIGVAALYVMCGCFGVVMGTGAQRRWSFGRVVATLALAGFLLNAAGMITGWEESRLESAQAAESFLGFMAQNDSPPENQKLMKEAFAWMAEHMPYIAFGMMFGFVLLGTVLATLLFAKLLPSDEAQPRPQGNFRGMRPSDWLVWVAIGAAVLGIVDSQWPDDALRAISWNTGIGLAFIYWLNGIGILAYGITAFQLAPMWVVLIVFALVWLRLDVPLMSFGFFDTWWNFREKLSKFAELRRLQNGSRTPGGPDNE